MNWTDKLRDIICDLYQQWGGNCSDLGNNPSAWIDTVQNAYAKAGAPGGSPAVTLGILTQLQTHLASSQNSLSPTDNARINTLIANIEKDLGATP